jgi:hypothetical protein
MESPRADLEVEAAKSSALVEIMRDQGRCLHREEAATICNQPSHPETSLALNDYLLPIFIMHY